MFWSFICATIVPLIIICGWFGLDFLQENRTSVAYLVGSGLNSNFHSCAHIRMTSRSRFNSFADISMEKRYHQQSAFLVCRNTDFGNMLIEVQFIINCDSQKFNRFAAYDFFFAYFNAAIVVVNN